MRHCSLFSNISRLSILKIYFIFMCICLWLCVQSCVQMPVEEQRGPLGAGLTLESSPVSVMDNELAGPPKNKCS